MDTVAEAKRKCPSLVLVHTETFSHLDLPSSTSSDDDPLQPSPSRLDKEIGHRDDDHDDEHGLDDDEDDRDDDRDDDGDGEGGQEEGDRGVGPEEGGFFVEGDLPSKTRPPSSSTPISTSTSTSSTQRKVKGTEKVTLRRYREASGRVFDILRSVGFDLSPSSSSSSSIFKGEEGKERKRVAVEKASVDEAYLDLTEMCQRRISSSSPFPSSSSSSQSTKSPSSGWSERVVVSEEEWKSHVLSPDPSLLSPHDLLLFHASHVLSPPLSISHTLPVEGEGNQRTEGTDKEDR